MHPPLLNDSGWVREILTILTFSCSVTHRMYLQRDLTRRAENAMPPPLKRLRGIFLKPDRRVTAAAANPFEKSARGRKDTFTVTREGRKGD